jgi:hypothetical protein
MIWSPGSTGTSLRRVLPGSSPKALPFRSHENIRGAARQYIVRISTQRPSKHHKPLQRKRFALYFLRALRPVPARQPEKTIGYAWHREAYMDYARVCSLLEAKQEIESTLRERGVELDAQARASIGWALKALVEDDGYSLETAVERILEIHRTALANAA